MLQGLQDRGLVDKLICMGENTGVHWGHNTLLDLVESEPWYVSTDNDLVPSVPVDGDDWLSRLIKLGRENPEYGAIACRPHILIGEGRDLFDIPGDIRGRGHVGAHLRLMQTNSV